MDNFRRENAAKEKARLERRGHNRNTENAESDTTRTSEYFKIRVCHFFY